MVRRCLMSVLVVGALTAAGCAKNGDDTPAKTKQDFLQKSGSDWQVSDIAAYRDYSQCEGLPAGVVAKKASGRITIPGIGDISLDPLKNLENRLSSQLSEAELAQRFSALASDVQRNVTNRTANISLDAAVYSALSASRQTLESSRTKLAALKTSAGAAAYPISNFVNEVLPNDSGVANENFFDSFKGHIKASLSDNGVTIALSRADAEGVAVNDLSPNGLIIEGLNAAGTKVTEFKTFTFSSVLAETASDKNQLAIATISDYSGSMRYDLDAVETSLQAFYDVYPSGFPTELIKFSQHTTISYQLGSASGAELGQAILRRPALGATAIYDAVTTGVSDVCRAPGYKAILLLTDGQDNSSSVTLEQTIAFAKANRIPLFIIGFGFADKNVLQRLADETGGIYVYFPYSIYSELGGDRWKVAYSMMANMIQNQYLVTLHDIPQDVKTLAFTTNVRGVIKSAVVNIR